MPFALTPRIVEAYRDHKMVCQLQGVGQTQFYHRHPEGVLTAVPGFPNNTDYSNPGPRTANMPTDPAVNVWMTWEVVRLRGGVDGGPGGDTAAGRAWMFRTRGQCPAIDDNGNQIILTDEDLALDPIGTWFRVENPALSADGSFWQFEIVRQR